MTKAAAKPPATRKTLSDARAIAMLNSARSAPPAWVHPVAPEVTDDTFFDVQRGWNHPVDIYSSSSEPTPAL